MISINPYCRAEKVKANGKAPIIIYVKKTGEPRKAVNSGIEIEPNFFDNKKQKFRKGSGDSIKFQAQLEGILSKMRDFALVNPGANASQVIDSFKSENTGDFIHFARGELFVDRQVLSFKAWEQYGYCLDLVEKYWSDNVSFNELTAEGLRLFDYQMKIAGLGVNTRKHAMKTVRKYSKRAIQKGLLSDNPFDHFKVGNYQEANREWTDENEIELLKNLWERRDTIPSRLHASLIHYLHSCHCGLRAIDSRRFTTAEHVKGSFIVILPSKSKEISQTMLRIPINDYASYLHKYIATYPLKQSHSRITNDLKEIFDEVGISKKITFHCARHSFAINSLIKGVPLEVVSKWLGHTNISTTQIYGKIVDSLSGAQMEKWNDRQDIFISLEEIGLSDKFKSKQEAIDFIKTKLS